MDSDEMKKSFLGQVHGTLSETSKRGGQSMLALAVVTSFAYAITVERVGFDGVLRIGGIEVSLGKQFPFALCSVLVALFQIHYLTIERYRVRLKMTVLRLYEELGFRDRAIAPAYCAFEYPSLFATDAVGTWRFLRLALFAVLFVLGPIVAQILAIAALTEPWMKIAATLFAVASVACAAYFLYARTRAMRA